MNDAAVVVAAPVPVAESIAVPDARGLVRETVIVAGLLWVPAFLYAVRAFLHPKPQAPAPFHVNVTDFITYALLIALVLHLANLRGESIATFTERFSPMDLLSIGLLCVMVLGINSAVKHSFAAAFPDLVRWAARPTNHPGRGDPLWWNVAISIRSGVIEETVMRGYLQTRLRQLGSPRWATILVSASLQSAYHIYYGWFGMLGTLVTFLIYAALYEYSRRLWVVLGTHVLFDVWLSFLA
jgi:membrane protease YdiL (CAAX protease family)